LERATFRAATLDPSVALAFGQVIARMHSPLRLVDRASPRACSSAAAGRAGLSPVARQPPAGRGRLRICEFDGKRPKRLVLKVLGE
jgi:hypothetical protein